MILYLEIIVMMIGVVSTTLLCFVLKEVITFIKQLQYINEKDTNQRITTTTGQPLFRELAAQINKLIQSKKQVQQTYEKMDRELREAVTNISHDLRTPLTSMRGYLQLIEGKELTEDKKASYLSTITSRSEVLQELVENFYVLSYVHSSTCQLELEQIHIGNLFCEQMASFYEEFISKEIKPKIEIEETLPRILGDPRAFNRIFMNLIQNVLRYGKNEFKIHMQVNDGYLVVECINETEHLKAEDAAFIFDRCFTGNKARTQQGTGIGLAVVKSLVEKMNGTIEAEVKEESLSIRMKWKV